MSPLRTTVLSSENDMQMQSVSLTHMTDIDQTSHISDQTHAPAVHVTDFATYTSTLLPEHSQHTRHAIKDKDRQPVHISIHNSHLTYPILVHSCQCLCPLPTLKIRLPRGDWRNSVHSTPDTRGPLSTDVLLHTLRDIM